MAFTVTQNIIEGMSASESNGAVETHTSSYIVKGLPEDFGTNNPGQKLLTSVAAVNAGLPAPGSPMTDDDDETLHVVNRTVAMQAPTMATVQVTWQAFDNTLNGAALVNSGQSGTSLKSLTTTSDAAGQPLEVEHGSVTRVGQVSVVNPELTYKRTVLLTLPQNTHPQMLSMHYVARVNSSSWFGLPKSHWMCIGCTPRVVNMWKPWPFRVAFDFSFAGCLQVGGWSPLVEWKDPVSGLPPEGLTDSGRKRIDWYQGQNFNIEPQTIADAL